nr:probable CTD kinase subunit alpha homolog [Penaeus vannamei]
MLVRRLGEGGSAKVDLVRWGKGVACLKVAKCEGYRDEFLREAEILHLVGGAGGAPRLLAVAERPPALLVSFRGFRTFHALRSLRPPDLTYLHVLWSLAECVAEIHTAGVIHTDLKPDNVMVTLSKRPDGLAKVRIVDFGHGRRPGEHPVTCDGSAPRATSGSVRRPSAAAGSPRRPTCTPWASSCSRSRRGCRTARPRSPTSPPEPRALAPVTAVT